jgi:hypothetical protein
MKASKSISNKHIAIDKASAQMIAVMAVCAFITVFALVASNAVWGQHGYLSRVTKEKEKAHKQLQTNVKAVSDLTKSYRAFVSTPTNVIGGNIQGTGDNDGDNAKIILDALPPQYDFPALATSLEKILKDHNLNITGIGGTDDQVAQQTNQSSPNPQPVSMPFTFSVGNANYSAVQDLMGVLQRSIRPIQIDNLTLTGGASDMQLTVNAHTYYQPEKDLKITTKVVK